MTETRRLKNVVIFVIILNFVLSRKIVNFFKEVIYFFCCQGHLKHFLKNYRFCRKFENDASSGGRGGSCFYVIMMHRVQKLICDTPLGIKTFTDQFE